MAKKTKRPPAPPEEPELRLSGRWASPWLLPPLLALVFARCVGHTLILRDAFQYFAPNKFLMAQALRGRTVHAWYPWQLLGMPFVADIQSSWFYPLNVLYLVLPFEPAYRLYILIHYPMAAFFMAIFLRGRGLARIPALLGALAFALCGYLVCQHATVTMLVGLAWAPLALHFADEAVRGRISAIPATGAVLAMQVLGGDPQAALITSILIAARGIAAWIARPKRRGPILSVAAVGAVSFVLSAIQILPTFEMMRMSVRSAGIDPKESVLFSFHPARLVELVWATPFGGVWPSRTFWASFAVDGTLSTTPWAVTNYVGLPIVALAIVGFLWSRRRWGRSLGIAAIVFFLMALGKYAPVYGLVHGTLSVLGFFRYPEKYMGWLAGCLAIGAALGLEQLLQWMRVKPSSVVRWAVVHAAVAIGILVLGALVWPRFVSAYTGSVSDPGFHALAVSHLLAGGAQLALVNLAAAGLVIAIAKRRLPADAGLAALLGVLVLDWTLANVATIPLGPRDLYEPRPLAAGILSPEGTPPLGQFRIFREPMELRGGTGSEPERLARQRVWDRSTLKRNLDAMEGFEDVVGYNAGQLAQGLGLLKLNLTPQVLEILNVRYVLSPYGAKGLNGIQTESVYSDRDADLTVTRLPGARPRAYFTSSVRYAASDAEAISLLRSPQALDSVILTGSGKSSPPETRAASFVPVKIERYEPERVVLTSESDRVGWVVLSDRDYPGWMASVDGKPVAIERANVLVRAVAVPMGKHEIVFTFRSTPLRIGAWISILAWAVLLAFWIQGLLRRKPWTGSPVLSVPESRSIDQATAPA